MLQGDLHCSYGYLLPVLVSLRNNLNDLEKKDFEYCKPLLQGIKLSLNRRFSDFFDIKGNGKMAAVASATHPFFKNLKWLNSLSKTAQKNVKLAIKEYASLVTVTSEIEENIPEKSASFLKNFNFGDVADQNSTRIQAEVYNVKNIEIELKNDAHNASNSFEILNAYPAVKELFLRTNTALPSSAPVERLFSYATMFNIPKFNRLSDEHFELRVVMKANHSANNRKKSHKKSVIKYFLFKNIKETSKYKYRVKILVRVFTIRIVNILSG